MTHRQPKMPPNDPTHDLAEMRIRRAARMQWRIQRYGHACFMPREYEAIAWELYALRERQLTSSGNQRYALQQVVASNMGVNQQYVSKLLRRAADVMLYLADIGVWAGFTKVGWREWTLEAPIAPVPMPLRLPPIVQAPPRTVSYGRRGRVNGNGLAAR